MDFVRIAARITDALTNSLSPEEAERINDELQHARGPGKASQILESNGLRMGPRRGRSWSVNHQGIRSPLRTHYLWIDNNGVPELVPKSSPKPVNWAEVEERYGPFTKEPEE